MASASFNDSDIRSLDPESATQRRQRTIKLPGLSKRVYNLTAYYEHTGFEARISQRRRRTTSARSAISTATRTLRYVVGEESPMRR